MIHEDEARRLLQSAADTIDVTSTAPLPEPAPRRTPWLAAAAALVVLGAGAGIALGVGGDDDAAAPPATQRTDSTQTADDLPEGSVPLVLGMMVDDAKAELEARGLTVRLETGYDCLYTDGRVMETEPGLGLVPDGAVTLTISQGIAPNVQCSGGLWEEDWAILDLAQGRAPADDPGFAPEVSVVVDGGAATTLTRAQALDPATWTPGSGLAIVGAALDAVRPPAEDGDAWQKAQVSSRFGLPPLTECGITRPGSEADLDVTTLSVDSRDQACGAAVQVYRQPPPDHRGLGEVVALVVRSPQTGSVEKVEVPDVRGLRKDDAREAIIAAGLAVTTNTERRCDPGTGVTQQTPKPGASAAGGDVVHLALQAEPKGANCAGLSKAANDLLTWARGGAAPRFADQVTLMRGYAETGTLSAAEAAGKGNWRNCPPAISFCLSALDAIADTDGPIQRRWDTDNMPQLDDGRYLVDCTADLGGLPDGFYDATRIHLYPPSSLPCNQQWEVSVWVDETGAITGVNYAPPR